MLDLATARGAAEACAALRIPALPAEWMERWGQSDAGYGRGQVPFLSEGAVREQCAFVRMAPDLTEALVAAAAGIACSPLLERLAWHCHWLLFRSGVEVRAGEWPAIPADADPAGPLFHAITYLSGVPHVRRLHAARGIDPEITGATLSDLELWIREGERLDGVPSFREMCWLIHHFQGRLYSLGRLQYLPGRFHHPFRFYRHRASGKVTALVEDRQLLRADGQFAGADGGTERHGLWFSRLQVDEEEIRGNPVDPRGHVLPEEMALRRPDWCEVLRRGDPVMTVHIPATGPMEPGACGESFRQAIPFFAAHCPDVPFQAFTCHSWLCGPQFETLDPPPANIVGFLREFYLHPTEHASGWGTLSRVFGHRGPAPLDLDTAPQRSSLQRALVSFLRAGGRCRDACGVLFPEDLDWGRQVYRTMQG